jgi:hypothetical protein
MNRLSIYHDIMYAYLSIPVAPISKRQLGKQLIAYLAETGAEVWEPVSCTKYMDITEPLAALSGLLIDSRYYFYRDGVMDTPFWDFVTRVHRRWWLRYAAATDAAAAAEAAAEEEPAAHQINGS